MSNAVVAPLHLSVDIGRLREQFRSLPSQREEILMELVENAFHSGARNIEFIADERDGTLIVYDDAPTPAPSRVIILPDEVVFRELNGSGLIALLNIAGRIEVESYSGKEAWRLTMTPDVLNGAGVNLEWLPEPEGDPHFKIVAYLRLGHPFDPPNKWFRQYFPLKVIWSRISAEGQVSSTDIEPLSKGSHDLITPVGILRSTPALGPSVGLMILRHRAIPDTDFVPDLKKVLWDMPDGRYVADALYGVNLSTLL